MKPMSLLACGIVVSSLGAAIQVHAESLAGNFALHADTQASLQAWKKDQVRGREPTLIVGGAGQAGTARPGGYWCPCGLLVGLSALWMQRQSKPQQQVAASGLLYQLPATIRRRCKSPNSWCAMRDVTRWRLTVSLLPAASNEVGPASGLIWARPNCAAPLNFTNNHQPSGIGRRKS